MEPAASCHSPLAVTIQLLGHKAAGAIDRMAHHPAIVLHEQDTVQPSIRRGTRCVVE